MKTKLILCHFMVALSVAGLFPTTSPAAAPTAAESKAKLQAACEEIVTLRTNIVFTLEQLDRVRNPQNRQEEFQKFRLQLTNMVGLVHQTAERVRTMKEKGSAYFAEWEARTKQLQDPEKRRNAESRYDVRKQSYDRMLRSLQEARGNFEPFLSDLTQIQRLLDSNPDAAKIAAAKDLFMHANWRCIDVQRSLMQTEAELTFLAADFAHNEK